MCIFSRPINQVFGTKIFARLSGRGTQFLAYEMNYDSDVPNAMILPLPVKQTATEKSIRFIDLQGYPKFFEDLSAAFPYIGRSGIGCSSMLQTDDAKGSIEVHDVGDFIASFVPKMADFDRLDSQFIIPNETWSLIPEYSDYGFAVFQLKSLVGKSHPMAFEFETRMNKVFFPTVHIHDGEVHGTEHFDHELYTQHAGLDSIAGKYFEYDYLDRYTQFTRSQNNAAETVEVDKTQGIVEPNLLLHRRQLTGNLKNQDMIFEIAGDPITTSFNFRKWSWVAPWGLLAVGLAWFFHRRNQVRQVSKQSNQDIQLDSASDSETI